jgi:hypothetical protein
MGLRHSPFASAKARDLLAGLEAHVPEDGYGMTLDGIEQETPDEKSSMNDAEANNLSFIVSDKFTRMDNGLTAPESDDNDASYAQLSERVAKRLNEISKRLAGEPDDTAENAR